MGLHRSISGFDTGGNSSEKNVYYMDLGGNSRKPIASIPFFF